MALNAYSNQFEQQCIIHEKECDIYCTQCDAFICSMCEDPHLSTSYIIHAGQIYQYLTALSHTEQPIIRSARSRLEELFNESLQLIRKSFKQLLEGINNSTGCDPSIEKFKARCDYKSLNRIERLLQNNSVKNKIASRSKNVSRDIIDLIRYGRKLIHHLSLSSIQNHINKSMRAPHTCAKFYQIQSASSLSVATQLNSAVPNRPALRESINFKIYTFKSQAYITDNSQAKDLIHYWKDSSVTLYNPINKSKSTVDLNIKINSCADSISYGSRIFIMGGNLIDNTYEVDISNKSLTNKEKMGIAKYCHTLCSNKEFIYSIGGIDGIEPDIHSLTDCEKYNVVADAWQKLPNIGTARAKCAVAMLNGCIYAFGGINYQLGVLNSLEKFDSKWDVLKIDFPPSPRDNIHSIGVSNSQILLIGGCCCKLYRDCYILNITNSEVKCNRTYDLEIDACFFNCSSPVLLKNKIYAVDFQRRIHVISCAGDLIS
jgi:hypothetical protein